MKAPPGNITWLPDDEYSKAVGQFRLNFGTLVGTMLEPLEMYGQKHLVDTAVLEIVKTGTRL